MNTTAAKIRNTLHEITDQLAGLMKAIPINHLNRFHSGLVIIAPEYYWGERTPEHVNAQIELKKKYDTALEILKVIFGKAPKDVSRRLEEADKRFRRWLELKPNWSLSGNRAQNETKLREDINDLLQLLDILEARTAEDLILIPDTNSLLVSVDPVKYKCIAGEKRFVFLLLPTVLSELDELKIHHRNQDVREKSQKIIKRIKGWRIQGPLLRGVTVDKTIIVQTVSDEPNMESTLSWLDKDNRDDRIVASVIQIQASYPASRVILVTGDINLQNKAEAAMIEFSEIGEGQKNIRL